MAPKASAKASAKAKTKAGRVKHSTKPLKQNRWAKAPAKKCKACLQTTHEVDRDTVKCGDPQWLQWTKSTTTASGLVKPSGEECYRCMDTRIRFFEEHLDELCEKKDAQPELEQKFKELRYDRVSKEKVFKDLDKVDTKQYTEKTDTNYDDKFQSGSCQAFWDFVAERRLGLDETEDPEELEAAMEFVRQKYPMYSVYWDDDGRMVVDMPDSPGKAVYRYKRGVNKAVVHRQQQEHEDKAEAKERYEAMTGKRDHACLKMEKRGRELDDEGGASGDELSAMPPNAPAASTLRPVAKLPCVSGSVTTARQEPPLRDAASDTKSEGAGSGVAKNEATSSTRTPQKRTARQLALESAPSEIGTDGLDGNDDVGEGDASELPSGKKRRRSRAEIRYDNLAELLESTENEMDWRQHWDSLTRKRDFESLMGRLKSQARACSGNVQDPESLSLSDRAFNFVDMCEARAVFFNKVRNHFVELSESRLSADDKKIWSAAPASLGATIVTSMLMKELETRKLTPTLIITVCRVASNKEPACMGFASFENGVYEHRHTSQKQIVSAMADRLWKSPLKDLLITCGRALQTELPALDMSEAFADTAARSDFKDLPSHGWFPQQLFDAHVCRVMALSLQDEVPMKLKHECRDLAGNQRQISTRLRLHFKAAPGSQSQLGKIAWERIQRFAGDVSTVDAACRGLDASEMQGLATKISEKENEKFEDLFNETVSVIESAEDKLAALGLFFGMQQNATRVSLGAKFNLFEAAAAVYKSLLMFVDGVIKEVGTFSKFLEEKMLPSSVEMLGRGRDKSDAVEGGEESGGDDEFEYMTAIIDAFVCVLQIVRNFEQSPNHVVAEAEFFAKQIQQLTSLSRKPMHDEESLISICEKWTQMCVDNEKVKRSRKSFSSEEHGSRLQDFVNVCVQEKWLHRCVVGVCSAVVRAGDVLESSLIRELQRREGSLPGELADVRKASTHLNKLEMTYGRIDEGKAVGLQELTTSLAVAKGSPTAVRVIMAGRENFAKMLAGVETEWRASVRKLQKHFERSEIFEKFFADYKGVEEAVVAWNFDDVDWIEESSATKEQKEFSKSVLGVIRDMNGWKNSVDAVLETQEWADAEEREIIKELKKSSDDAEVLTKKASHQAALQCMACVVYANSEKEKLNQSIKFCVSLGVDYKTFHAPFVKRINDMLRGVTAKVEDTVSTPAAAKSDSKSPAGKTTLRRLGKK